MAVDPNLDSKGAQREGSLLALALLALIVGAGAGLIGALFQIALKRGDACRNTLIAWAHGEHFVGLLLLAAVSAAAVAVAAWLVCRFSPAAAGSGVPHVEAVLRGDLPQMPFYLLLVKFVGGLLAIGAGLALGREGPSIQMGASIGNRVGQLFRRSVSDCRVLLAAGAGAGLGTAFNAPIAGAIFVLEELVQQFETRIAIAALGASATAIAVARIFIGDAPDFHVDALVYADAQARPLYFVLGAIAGLVAILYNRALLATIAAANRLERWPVPLRAALIGAAIGILAWFAPGLVGGGDAITQRTLSGAGCIGHRSADFSAAICARYRVLRGTHTGRPVRAHAGARRTTRSLIRRRLSVGISRSAHPTGRLRRGRNGGIFHRRSALSADRHRARRRNDCQRPHAAAHAGRVFRGHAGADPAARPTDLRNAAGQPPAGE